MQVDSGEFSTDNSLLEFVLSGSYFMYIENGRLRNDH